MFCPSQYLQSPNFPSNYPDGVRCQWVIAAPRYEKIHFKFTDFELEQSQNCANDHVAIEGMRSVTNLGSKEKKNFLDANSMLFLFSVTSP